MLGLRRSIGRVVRAIDRVFPEREFHYRAQGRVKYFSLTRGFQVGLAAILLIAIAWGGYATYYFVTFDAELRARNIEVAQARRGQREMRAEVERFTQRLQQVARALEHSRSALRAIARTNGVQTDTAADGSTTLSDADRARMLASQQALGAQIEMLSEAYENLNTRSALIEQGLASYGNEIETILSQHSSLTQQNRQLRAQLEDLQARYATMRETQRQVVARLEDRTSRSIEEIERVIAMTGLDANDLLSNTEENGQGGPVLEIETANDEDEELNRRIAQVQRRISRWENLQRIVRNLPLIAPIDHYRLSSGFGRRRDPVSGRWSSHNGLDFAYHRNTPVLSTARGTVVYAGWRGGYGWTVEIDHGMGLRTRYAHLRRILVERGQEVGFRETIGLLGSSGRSTGPHVHYEIIVNGNAENPMKFITAGKYVFKG